MLLTSQGVTFLHAGQEYGRTKQWKSESKPISDFTLSEGFENPYFIENSYDASDAVNMFDWDKVLEDGIHKTTMEYTKGLIKLRKSTDAFRHATETDILEHVRLIQSPDILAQDLLIAYSASSTKGEEFLIFINADSKQRTLRMNENLSSGIVIVDADESGTTAVSNPNGFLITSEGIVIDPLTAIILKK